MRSRSWPRKAHFLLAASIAIVVGGSRGILQGWYAGELRRVGEAAAAAAAREKERAWRDLPYITVGKVSLGDVLLQHITLESFEITPTQRSTLRSRLNQVASYLQSPTFEQYYCLRTEGLQYRLIAHGSSTSSTHGGPTAEDDKRATKLLWEDAHRNNGKISPPQITGVCPEKIAAVVSRTNTIKSLVFDGVAKGFTVLVEHSNPGFVYPTATRVAGTATRNDTFFHLSFYAKVDHSERAGPVYISLWWQPENQAWALGGLLTDKSLGIRTIF